MSSSQPQPPRIERVYVLYGSQTGNSQQAAEELCQQVPAKLNSLPLLKRSSVQVRAEHMQLDDFLELRKADWTRLVVVVTSSYGVGQAPLGCYRFRDLCEAWLERYSSAGNNNDKKKKQQCRMLEGVQYALLGLGDSKYTTFFQNPTRIDEGMQAVGAKRVGPLGKADASGLGDQTQSLVIERWIESIWQHLAQVVVLEPLSDSKLREMQAWTVSICKEINPEFEEDDEIDEKKNSTSPAVLVLAFVVAGVAAVAYYYRVLLLTKNSGGSTEETTATTEL